jgi:hypothetical protein
LIGIVGVGGGFVAGFAERAMIDKGADRDAVDELRDAAGVVDVVVGEQHIVDVVEAGIFGGGDDAVGVASFIVGPSGVDEEGVAIGSDEEGGLASFNVDEENLEVIGGALGAEGGAGEEGDDDKDGRLHEGSEGKKFNRAIIDRESGDGTGSCEQKQPRSFERS